MSAKQMSRRGCERVEKLKPLLPIGLTASRGGWGGLVAGARGCGRGSCGSLGRIADRDQHFFVGTTEAEVFAGTLLDILVGLVILEGSLQPGVFVGEVGIGAALD